MLVTLPFIPSELIVLISIYPGIPCFLRGLRIGYTITSYKLGLFDNLSSQLFRDNTKPWLKLSLVKTSR